MHKLIIAEGKYNRKNMGFYYLKHDFNYHVYKHHKKNTLRMNLWWIIEMEFSKNKQIAISSLMYFFEMQ